MVPRHLSTADNLVIRKETKPALAPKRHCPDARGGTRHRRTHGSPAAGASAGFLPSVRRSTALARHSQLRKRSLKPCFCGRRSVGTPVSVQTGQAKEHFH